MYTMPRWAASRSNRVLEQPQEEVLHVLADVARFRDRRGVADGEGDLELAGERPGQQGLAAARRPDQQHVRLVELDLAVADIAVEQPLVVVVHRHRQVLLRPILADHVLIEVFLDIPRLGRLLDAGAAAADLPAVLLDDVVAQFHALRTDEHVVRPLDQGIRLIPGAPAEAADRLHFPAVWLFAHPCSLVLNAVVYRKPS
jgi:hypothetical protein